MELDTTARDFGTDTPLAGMGYGLPLSRMYARYWGGELQVISMEGYGTAAAAHVVVIIATLHAHIQSVSLAPLAQARMHTCIYNAAVSLMRHSLVLVKGSGRRLSMPSPVKSTQLPPTTLTSKTPDLVDKHSSHNFSFA